MLAPSSNHLIQSYQGCHHAQVIDIKNIFVIRNHQYASHVVFVGKNFSLISLFSSCLSNDLISSQLRIASHPSASPHKCVALSPNSVNLPFFNLTKKLKWIRQRNLYRKLCQLVYYWRNSIQDAKLCKCLNAWLIQDKTHRIIHNNMPFVEVYVEF